jgi:hypothetical protein
MPIRHDLSCRKCGHLEESFIFASSKSLKEDEAAEVCPSCGERDNFRITFELGGRIGQIDVNNAEMYGKPWHSFGGRIVKDYAHKMRLMKRFGMIEAGDSVGGSKEPDYPPGYNGPGQPMTPQKSTEVPDDVIWGDDPKDLERKMADATERIQSSRR